MRALFVYDASIQKMADLGSAFPGPLQVTFFPLLGDESLRSRLTDCVQDSGSSVVHTLDSARLVEWQVTELGACAEWSAILGASAVNGRSLKEQLLIPGLPLSAWWLGHISERNPLKTNAFLCLAQLAAVRQEITSGKYERLIVAVGDPAMQRSLALLGQEARLTLNVVTLKRQLSLKQRFIAAIKKAGAAGEMLRACYTWVFFVRRALIARFVLRGSSRNSGDLDSCLFISHFAAVDKRSATEGVFRNKYFLPLQELMAREGRGITWLLLYVPIYGYTFRDACELAKRFSAHGETLSILEENLNLRGAFSAISLWFRIALRAIRLYPKIDRAALYPSSVGPAAEPIIQALWWSSYAGATAMEGVLYLLMFQAYLKKTPSLADVLYFFENYPLEKALLAAGRVLWPKARFLAYQHTTVPRNLFPYFCSRHDTKLSNLPEDMPLPDHVIANGGAARSLLNASAFPGLIEAEAIRYFYIERGLSDEKYVKSDQPTLLIAGSHDRAEMLSTMRLVRSQIHTLEAYEVWVKGHPGLPLEPILKEAGIHPLPDNWSVRNEDISQLLPPAWAVLVPASTVAVEALAYGCEVISPVFPDVLGMNPLSDHEGYCHRVYGGRDLVAIMTRIREVGPSEARRNRGRDFVRRYWNLDQKMPLWSRLLVEYGGRRKC